MSPRSAACIALAAVVATLAACRTSSPYATPASVAVGTGLAVAAAGVNRAITHECWAACRPGTICDKATGLCVEPGARSRPKGGPGHLSPVVSSGTPYPPGHTYEVPPAADALMCDPAHEGAADAGALGCELDASVPQL
jgi:hypothetical protein